MVVFSSYLPCFKSLKC